MGIKFNSWIPNEKVMLTWEEDLRGNPNLIGKLLTGEIECINLLYSGLNDFNGKGIHTGDIVIVDLNWNGGRVGKETFVVEYTDGCFFIHTWSFSVVSEALRFNEIKTIEVIGNIYKNSNLVYSK